MPRQAKPRQAHPPLPARAHAAVTSVEAQSFASTLSPAHRRRLRALWQSAGWPHHDLIDVELIVAGCLERREDASGRETLRLTERGLAAVAATLQSNRKARDEHEALVRSVATLMQRAGRVVWCGLSLRALVTDSSDCSGGDTRWAVAMPDVFSIRHTSAEHLVEPIVHEIKVRRADLLSDLRHEAKREAYLSMAGACWYVLKAGVGDASDVPETCGVMLAHASASSDGPWRLEVLRPAPQRAKRLSFATWMALARSPCLPVNGDPEQAAL